MHNTISAREKNITEQLQEKNTIKMKLLQTIIVILTGTLINGGKKQRLSERQNIYYFPNQKFV